MNDIYAIYGLMCDEWTSYWITKIIHYNYIKSKHATEYISLFWNKLDLILSYFDQKLSFKITPNTKLQHTLFGGLRT